MTTIGNDLFATEEPPYRLSEARPETGKLCEELLPIREVEEAGVDAEPLAGVDSVNLGDFSAAAVRTAAGRGDLSELHEPTAVLAAQKVIVTDTTSDVVLGLVNGTFAL
jgi:hypothetical protein